MYTEDEAKTKYCLIFLGPRPGLIACCASQCGSYWRWADAEHTKGYCSAGSKPEF